MIYVLDVNGFAQELTGQLAGMANGYALELRSGGATVFASASGDAIAPIDANGGAPTPWSSDVSMHIASISKLITAMALTKLLTDTPGVTAADPISAYLPAYWNPGLNVDLITFNDVMTHTSGLTPPAGPGTPANQTYLSCREAVESGVADPSKIGGSSQWRNWDYQNTNFALCRVLMATVGGAIDVNFNYTGPRLPPNGTPIIVEPPGGHLTQEQANDEYWDAVTLQYYIEYVQNNVLAAAGVEASLWRPDGCALAYAWPADGQPGWNSGNLVEWAGPAGYHMSVNDLLDVMGTFRRGGTILDPAQAQAMLDAQYGIDWGDGAPGTGPNPSPAGSLYCKNGGQDGRDADGRDEREQSVAAFLPLDMECVVFVNSPIVAANTNDAFLLGMVAAAFVDNVKHPQLPRWRPHL